MKLIELVNKLEIKTYFRLISLWVQLDPVAGFLNFKKVGSLRVLRILCSFVKIKNLLHIGTQP